MKKSINVIYIQRVLNESLRKNIPITHKEMTQTLRITQEEIHPVNKHLKGLSWIIRLLKTAMAYYFASFIFIEKDNTKDALTWPYFYTADGKFLEVSFWKQSVDRYKCISIW